MPILAHELIGVFCKSARKRYQIHSGTLVIKVNMKRCEMNREHVAYIDYRKFTAFAVLLMVFTVAVAQTALAGPSQSGYAPGHHVKMLPKGHMVVKHSGKNYYFHNGYYYQKNRNGFNVVTAPVGITIKKLPSGAQSVKIGTDVYYNYYGVYYKKSRNGYVVIERPRGIKITSPKQNLKKTFMVKVDSPVLNVRTAPAMGSSVTDRVYRGAKLTVRAKNNGWYYVRLPNGSFGWVNSRFTS